MTEQTMTNRELVDAAIELAGDFYSILTSKGYSRRHKAGGEFGRA